MPEKKYKRIGWTVEWRNPSEKKHGKPYHLGVYIDGLACHFKHHAIAQFNEASKGFFFLPKNLLSRLRYRWMRERGLARCVPVYVEVKDGS